MKTYLIRQFPSLIPRIIVDVSWHRRDSEDQRTQNSKRARKVHHAKIAGLKSELKRMLAQPLLATGVSARYITSGSRPIVDDLLAGECEEP